MAANEKPFSVSYSVTDTETGVILVGKTLVRRL